MKRMIWGATLVLAAGPAAAAVTLEKLGTYASGVFDQGASEIVAHDPDTQRLFVVNAASATVDVLDISDPGQPTKVGELAVGTDTVDGSGANSVDVANGLVAVAVERDPNQLPGYAAFYDSSTLAYLGKVQVGSLPDMLTFSPTGKVLLVANEGEPNADYTIDPAGSVSVVYLYDGVQNARVRTADFSAFNARKAELRQAGVRIFGPGASVSQDLEPEYIAVADTGPFAWVALQENNAIALINYRIPEVIDIRPLGYKFHNRPGNELDPSNQDNGINIANWPVRGMYQPDTIAFFRHEGRPFLISANEGDAREYEGTPGFVEAERIAGLTLDATRFPDAATLQLPENLGRLNVTTTLGDWGRDGDYDALYSFGTRSFSIWDAANGRRIYDSGNELESITANLDPDNFNSNNDDNDSFDSRSDDKGPEPEAVTVGELDGRRYAFIGLERVGGVMIYDITSPWVPQFVTWVNNRDFGVLDPTTPEAGDLGPECIVFIPAIESPIEQPLLVVGNEVSGTTTIFRIVPALN